MRRPAPRPTPPAATGRIAGARGPGQRGAALLTALLLVALIATLSVGMVWQQWRLVQVEAAERARAQSAWILFGATDYARLILREDARNGGADSLGEPWATPLAEARLSSFLATDANRSSEDGGPEAFLSGEIHDLQGRYNLMNLSVSGPALQAREDRVLARLMESAGLAPALAPRLAQALRQAVPPAADAASAAGAGASPGGPPDPLRPLRPERVGQLRWLGLDADSLARLQPWVTVLPVATPLNLNTAPREAIAAVLGTDLATAERLVQARQASPFRSLEQVRSLLPADLPLEPLRVGVASAWFEVRGRLRLEQRIVEEEAVLERRGIEVLTAWRERRVPLAPAPAGAR